MVNTGLRPDEAALQEFRDVEVVKDKATNETILEISVRGKRGVRYCKNMPTAVLPFNRIRNRLRSNASGDPAKPQPTGSFRQRTENCSTRFLKNRAEEG